MGPEKCTGHNGREMFNSARHKSQNCSPPPPQILKLPNTENKQILKAALVGEHEAKNPGDFSSRKREDRGRCLQSEEGKPREPRGLGEKLFQNSVPLCHN